jgi:hypothetical protein
MAAYASAYLELLKQDLQNAKQRRDMALAYDRPAADREVRKLEARVREYEAILKDAASKEGR